MGTRLQSLVVLPAVKCDSGAAALEHVGTSDVGNVTHLGVSTVTQLD